MICGSFSESVCLLSNPIVAVVECQTAFALFGVIFGLLVSTAVYLHAPQITVEDT